MTSLAPHRQNNAIVDVKLRPCGPVPSLVSQSDSSGTAVWVEPF